MPEKRDWCEDFKDLSFGDKRLDKRFFKIMDDFADSPEESVYASAGDRDQAKAVYRFFGNDSVTHDILIDSISKGTVAKMQAAECECVLLLQDTTSVSYGLREGIEGMGYYCDSEQRGMLVHSCLAVTDKGLPLGIVDQRDWTRPARKTATASKDKQKLRPIEEKENYRWIETLLSAHARVPADIPTINVCDQEGDFYELFAEAERHNEQFLVRLVQNRLTAEGKRLFDMLKEAEPMGSTVVRVGRDPRKKQSEREAQMQFCFIKVEIRKPARRKEPHLPDVLTLTAIYAVEVNPPPGEKPAHWFLMTNVPGETADDAVKLIGYYALRWRIERFHFVLKSGCGIEKLQAHSYDKLEKLILMYSVIAIQLLNITYMARLCPDAPADMFFEPDEQQTLYRAARKVTENPPNGYTLRETVRDLAALAGRKGAPSDGEPGVKALWKGLQKLYFLMSCRDYLIW